MTFETELNTLLSTLKDPITHLTAIEMGLKPSVETVKEGLILTLTAGFPIFLLEQTYAPLLLEALKKGQPNLTLDVQLQAFIKAHKTQLVGKSLRGVKNTLCVASGKGGVGKSTVTVNLAIALANMGARVGILDADIYGPSIPLMLGAVDPIAVKDEKYLPALKHGVQAMSIGYLTDPAEALIWRGPMLAKSLIQMLDMTLWDELDYLFIDLPPGTGDLQLSLVQKIPVTAAIVVTTPQPVATLDAQKAITMFDKMGVTTLGLVENMALHTCSHCQHEEAIFGSGGASQLAEKNNSILLGQLPLTMQIREDCDNGHPTCAQPSFALKRPYMQTALIAAIELAKKPLNYAGVFPEIRVEFPSR